MAAIFMANNNRPTERIIHVDIQCFALQQLVEENHTVLHRMSRILNPFDSLTKALA